MNFNEYINRSWDDHAADAEAVYRTLDQGVSLIQSNDDIPAMARLINHICGDHLGLWDEGITKIQGLALLSVFQKQTEADLTIQRLVATLRLSSDAKTSLQQFSTSEQIRIYAVASGQLFERGESQIAKDYFIQSLELAMVGLAKDDPANRAIAITGYNLACILEERPTLSENEKQLLILAAKNSRKYWEIAGGPSQMAVGEYRLSQAHLKIDKIEEAYEHAQQSVQLCQDHQLSALDHFYGYETLAQSESRRGNNTGFNKALEKMEDWYQKLTSQEAEKAQPTMLKIRALS